MGIAEAMARGRALKVGLARRTTRLGSKGKGRGPSSGTKVVCRRCGGSGHCERQCPSAMEELAAEDEEYKCNGLSQDQ